MRRPAFLNKLRAKMEANRQPDDPVNQRDAAPTHWTKVPLRDLQAEVIVRSRKDCDEWCRDQCQGQWSVRMDHGEAGERMIPIYSFSDAYEAIWFKIRFR